MILVDYGDNPLGGLFASSLRGPYLFPSRILHTDHRFPIRFPAGAHLVPVADITL